jgi:hypothetical protein
MAQSLPTLSPLVDSLLSRARSVRDVLEPIAALPGVMFFIKAADYRYVLMSPAIRESIGVEADDDPAGRTDFDLFPPLIAASFRENDRRVIEQGETLRDEVHVVVTRARGTQLASSSKWPIRDRDGKIIGLVGTNRPHESSGGMAVGDEAARVLPAITRMIRDYANRLPIAELAAACRLPPRARGGAPAASLLAARGGALPGDASRRVAVRLRGHREVPRPRNR